MAASDGSQEFPHSICLPCFCFSFGLPFDERFWNACDSGRESAIVWIDIDETILFAICKCSTYLRAPSDVVCPSRLEM